MNQDNDKSLRELLETAVWNRISVLRQAKTIKMTLVIRFAEMKKENTKNSASSGLHDHLTELRFHLKKGKKRFDLSKVALPDALKRWMKVVGLQ